MELKEFITEYFNNFRRAPGMYGGTLMGIESVWFTLKSFERFAYGIKKMISQI